MSFLYLGKRAMCMRYGDREGERFSFTSRSSLKTYGLVLSHKQHIIYGPYAIRFSL